MNSCFNSTGEIAAQMAAARRSTWNTSASHPRVVQMELMAHQITCQEYSVDILRHLIEIEQQSRPCYASFEAQPEISVQMRALIFDFVMCCHTRLGLSSSTLFLCFNIVDRYCSRIIVKSATYQLVALSSLWLASKYTDKKPRIPSLRALQSLCCNQYTKCQFRDMELHILKSLNWVTCVAPPHDAFVDILLKNKISSLSYKGLNLNDLKYGAVVLSELACFDHVLAFDYNASAVALAAVTLITHALRFTLDGQFLHYSAMLKDLNLQRVCDLLLTRFRSRNFPSSFRLKYMSQGKLESNPILLSLLKYDAELSPMKCSRNEPPGSTTASWGPSISRTPSITIPPTPSTPSTGSTAAINASGVTRNMVPSAATPTSCIASPIVLTGISNIARPAIFKRQHAKRNSSVMDTDFFDSAATVSCKRIH